MKKPAGPYRCINVKMKKTPAQRAQGGMGLEQAMLWVVATGSFDGVQSIALGLFTGIVQGVLVAGCSVYANQLVKQAGRAD